MKRDQINLIVFYEALKYQILQLIEGRDANKSQSFRIKNGKFGEI